MSVSESVQTYIARQPQLTVRRHMLRGFIRWLGFRVLWDVQVSGAQNVPDTGPAIIMMNHISAIDPILCMGAIQNRFVIPMTKIENAQHWFTGFFVWWWGAYTVKRGEVDRKALTNSIELIKSGQMILIAPEGTRHPDGLGEAKDGLAFVATKADAIIIPTGVSGAVGWNTKLKRLQRPHIQVNFGRPFKFKAAGARATREELAQMSQEAMYQLALAVQDETRRGFYSDVSQATTTTLDFINPVDYKRKP
ncbi:MAG: 1-acyl-sn-glycerol-3-phosphate acyltransferase [Anaerolineae bacterium]|nr:1-acyl-sn-glycerol-3-phosphate acyltransferase [Anaerolineae bacterium]